MAGFDRLRTLGGIARLHQSRHSPSGARGRSSVSMSICKMKIELSGSQSSCEYGSNHAGYCRKYKPSSKDRKWHDHKKYKRCPLSGIDKN